tara:strand:+ start:113 stop:418 length:306 start_codon:yes stop_codon:yes gene_type:complete
MLNQEDSLKASEILKKISEGESITISERLMLKELAKNNVEISQKIKKAQCNRRLNRDAIDDLTSFMGSLALDGTFMEEHFNPDIDNIGEWFSQSPEWLRRS